MLGREDKSVDRSGETITCNHAGGISACPVMAHRVWFMSPGIPIPIIPFFLAAYSPENEYCEKECIAIILSNDLDVPANFLLTNAKIIQDGRELKVAAIEMKKDFKNLPIQNSWQEPITVEPLGNLSIYFSGFKKDSGNASLRGLRYCLPTFCKDLEIDHLRFKTKWVYVYWTMSGGWTKEF